MKNKQITKAIIPAAGFGTRFLPVTKSVAKEMLPIIDKPTIQYIVEECVAAGITDILIIVSGYKSSIIDYFDYFYELEEKLRENNKMKEYEEIRKIADMVKIQFVRQKEQLGLGHAVLCAKTFVGNDPFAVLLGDDIVINNDKQSPAIQQCMDAYYKTGNAVVGVQEVPQEEVNKYGILKVQESISDGLFKVADFIEKPAVKDAPSRYAILGRYVFTPEIFNYLEKTPVGKGGEIQLTDAMAAMNKDHPIYGCVFSGRRYDCGSKKGYLEAVIDEALKRDDLKDHLIDYIKQKKI